MLRMKYVKYIKSHVFSLKNLLLQLFSSQYFFRSLVLFFCITAMKSKYIHLSVKRKVNWKFISTFHSTACKTRLYLQCNLWTVLIKLKLDQQFGYSKEHTYGGTIFFYARRVSREISMWPPVADDKVLGMYISKCLIMLIHCSAECHKRSVNASNCAAAARRGKGNSSEIASTLEPLRIKSTIISIRFAIRIIYRTTCFSLAKT